MNIQKPIEDSRYLIINKDCLDVLPEMQDDFIDLVVCDPPYKTTRFGMSGLGGAMSRDQRFKKGCGGFEYCNLSIDDYLPQLYRVMKPSAHGYLMTNNKNLVKFVESLNKNKFKVFKILIWDKVSKITNMYYMDQHEYIIFFRKGKAKRINNASTSSIISIPKVRAPSQRGVVWEKIHPSIKPVELMQKLILNSSKENDTILDFTMGSGTTAIASLSLNRNFIGMQIDPAIYKDTENRISYFAENFENFGVEEALRKDNQTLFYRIDKNGNRIYYNKD